jgi:hypothetical protein
MTKPTTVPRTQVIKNLFIARPGVSRMTASWKRVSLAVMLGMLSALFLCLLPLLGWVILRFPRFQFMFEGELASEVSTILVFPAIAGAINGIIGACDGLRSSKHGFWPVVAIPALMVFLPLAERALNPTDRDAAGIAVFGTIIFGGLIWLGGRLGQRIGILVSGCGTDIASAKADWRLTPAQILFAGSIASLLIIVTATASYILMHSQVRNFETGAAFQEYLWSNGEWSVPEPPRAGWKPGLVFEITASEFGPQGETTKSERWVRFLTDEKACPERYARRIAKSGFPRLRPPGYGEIPAFTMMRAKSTMNFKVDLCETESQSIDLSDLQEALTQTVGKQAESKMLYVITDVLVSDRIQIRRLWEEAQGINLNEIDAEFAPRAHINSKGHRIVSGPIVVAYKAKQLVWHGANAPIELASLNKQEQDRLSHVYPIDGFNLP